MINSGRNSTELGRSEKMNDKSGGRPFEEMGENTLSINNV
jgi:hypothetical protein